MMDWPPDVDSVVRMPRKVPYMFVSSTNHLARVLNSVPSPPHLLEFRE